MEGKGYSQTSFRDMERMCLHRLQRNGGRMMPTAMLSSSNARNMTIERRERLKALLEQALEISEEYLCYENERDGVTGNSGIDSQNRFVVGCGSSSSKKKQQPKRLNDERQQQ